MRAESWQGDLMTPWESKEKTKDGWMGPQIRESKEEEKVKESEIGHERGEEIDMGERERWRR